MSHAEKRSVEARNAELQRSLQQCAEQKEALERQRERGRRALESRWASRGRHGPRAPHSPTPGTSLIRGR